MRSTLPSKCLVPIVAALHAPRISIAILLTAFCTVASQAQQATLQKYCVHCHGIDTQEGDVRLDTLQSSDTELLTRVYEQVSSQQMPPGDEPQPSREQRSQLASHFLSLAKSSTQPETAALRRLNKREYSNTVRDLLGLHDGIFDPGKFIYKDEIAHGFDTQADSLVTSNELLLEYLQAAQSSLGQALFSLDQHPPEPDIATVKMSRLTGASRRYESKSGDAYIFRIGGNKKIYDASERRLMQAPGLYRITVTASAIDKQRYSVPFAPADQPPILAIGAVAGHRSADSELDRHEKSFPLTYGKERTVQVERWIEKGFHPYLRFTNGSSKPITQVRSNLRRKKITKAEANRQFLGPGIRVTEFKIEGPIYKEWPPQSVTTTIGSNSIPNLEDPKQRLYLLGRFAKRAFRRAVSREEMALWTEHLKNRYESSNDWRTAFVETMTAMMASPDFLYLREDEGQLDAFQLANRLSYFFWSTMPDAELFTLAESGQLMDKDVLQKQVDRLFNDPRSNRFSVSFADQWLSLDTLGTMPPDNKEFRFYNESLENAMRAETRSLFQHVLRQNRSVTELIDSDYTFLNEQLASLYGIPWKANAKKPGKKNIGGELVLTKLPQHSARGGVLGHASVLTLTSNGVETSPVVRGVWVLEHFLGTPAPPPPAEVPALVPDLNGAESVRQLLEKHRSDAACMKCHQRIDPLGFALESFDHVGRFRTKYSKRQKVSTEGRYMGNDFEDLRGLKRILAADLDLFARNLIIKIAEYAKGRKLVAADYPVVESILKSTENDGFKLKHMVYQIATSELMTNK
ncbi:MAG: DUF1592 domain-containing protein [Planctomycetota bacterium]